MALLGKLRTAMLLEFARFMADTLPGTDSGAMMQRWHIYWHFFRWMTGEHLTPQRRRLRLCTTPSDISAYESHVRCPLFIFQAALTVRVLASDDGQPLCATGNELCSQLHDQFAV